MTHPFLLQLRCAIRLVSEGDDLLVACADGRGLRSRGAGAAVRSILEGLGQGGQTAEQLIEHAVAAQPEFESSRLYFLLASLESKGFLNYTLAEKKGRPLATLEPISPAFRLHSVAPSGSFRFSRFACLRRDGEAIVVESPLGHARLVVHDARFCALPMLLATPHRMDELVSMLPGLDTPLLAALVALLVNAGVVFACDEAGQIPEDKDSSLRLWEFHDLFFHTRSRAGRHEYPMGATFRFKGELEHGPALKAPMTAERVALFRPVADTTGPDFFAVLEARRSRRTPGEAPMMVAQLGEFLWRSARVQTHVPPDPQRPGSYEATLRPNAGGGAIHELEMYLTVTRCEGLAQGLYHYDPLAHSLERLSNLEKKQQRLVQDAMNSSGSEKAPDVVITLAARFGRLAWKYEGMAYAAVQKHVGVLYQQMYLVATALGLAPCALGAGNSEAFAAATGLDYFAETSVGEFMLSSGPP